ncbi:MAG TPA: cupin domain-containing protein [Dehalococcoidia bacterium]|nr:cupin domain-containing protein [Dehalococcoidia bacterium]
MERSGVWNLFDVLESDPIQPGERFHWTWLATADHSTLNLVQAQGSAEPDSSRLHVHAEHDETAYIIQGQAQFRLGEETQPVQSGSVIFVPAGMVHGPVQGDKLAILSLYGPSFDPDNPDREFVGGE